MIRGKKKEIDKGINKVNVNVNIHNRFDIKVFDSETGKLKNEARAFNVICKGLWGALIREYGVNPYNGMGEYFDEIRFGQGSGTPSENDTNLFSQIDKRGCSSAISKESYDAPSGVYYITKYIKLDSSEYVGKTITEVGIGVNSNTSKLTSTLCTHAMLEDMNGNPISITKTDTDVIYIYATIYVHLNPYSQYDKGTIQFLRQQGDLNIHRWLAGSYLGYGIPMSAQISRYGTAGVGGQSGSTYIDFGTADYSLGSIGFTKTFDVENKKIHLKGKRLESTSGNVGGIRYLYLPCDSTGSNSYAFAWLQVGGDWYPYTEIKDEAVGTGDGTTTNFALDFQRAREVKVYIDGVETTDFSVIYAPATTTNPHYYMDMIGNESTTEHHVLAYYHAKSSTSFQGTRIFYNPFYEMGIKQIKKAYYTSISVSNDLEEWIEIGPSSSGTVYSFAIPEEYQHYKYWKAISTSTSGGDFPQSVVWANEYDGKALRFNNPPDEGAVITADYITDTIAKDADHVFDFEMEFSFGEYIEE